MSVTTLVERVARVPGVKAVTLGGSRARGMAQPDSDWDFGLYYRDSIDTDALRALGYPGQVVEPGAWGRIVNGGAWLEVDGERVDLLYRDLDVVEHWITEANAGRFEIDCVGGHIAGLPTYTLAGELALAGIDVLIVEPRPNQDIDGSRAGGLHARTLEVLDQRGIADRFLAEGQVMQVQGFAGIPLDICDFPTRFNHGLALWQSRIEPLLAEWVVELGVPILRGRSVVAFSQDDAGVDVALSDGTTQRAAYLVGSAAGRSLVRTTAGLAFPALALVDDEVRSAEVTAPAARHTPSGGPHPLRRRLPRRAFQQPRRSAPAHHPGPLGAGNHEPRWRGSPVAPA